jgi:hypothetical protein
VAVAAHLTATPITTYLDMSLAEFLGEWWPAAVEVAKAVGWKTHGSEPAQSGNTRLEPVTGAEADTVKQQAWKC